MLFCQFRVHGQLDYLYCNQFYQLPSVFHCQTKFIDHVLRLSDNHFELYNLCKVRFKV